MKLKLKFKNIVKGFTLAEMTVVMLILSAILAAASPIITKNARINSASSSTMVDPGVILLWYSNPGSAPPDGWALCDGSHGTPDLRGKFVYGASSGDAYVNITNGYGTGGASSHVLKSAELPTHTHTFSSTPPTGLSEADHSDHTLGGLSSQNSDHSHVMTCAYAKWVNNSFGSSESPAEYGIYGRQYVNGTYYGHPWTTLSGGHTHSVSLGSSGNHTHTLTVTNTSTSNASYDSRPPYTILAYIMKT